MEYSFLFRDIELFARSLIYTSLIPVDQKNDYTFETDFSYDRNKAARIVNQLRGPHTATG